MTDMSAPRNATLKTGTTVVGQGYLLTNDSTNNKLDLVTWGETVLGVSAGESERCFRTCVRWHCWFPTSRRSTNGCFKGFSDFYYRTTRLR